MFKLIACSMTALWLVMAMPAMAQSGAGAYPSKPIKIIVPFPAGGTSDVLARLLGQKMTEAWGQSVVVENRPGASGNLGADAGAKSSPDGYTLVLMDVGNLVISPALYKLPFNVLTDFAPVAMVGYSPHLLLVSTKIPANNISELVAYAKAQNGKVNFAAKPYLAAMMGMGDINEQFGYDSGRSIVIYFLNNASSWRGDVAKRVKAELRAMLK